MNFDRKEMKQLQERQVQTLNDIKKLKGMEQQLYASLERSGKGDNGSTKVSIDEQRHIINKMNELGSMRINMFQSLNDMYGNMNTDVFNTRKLVEDQATISELMSNEMKSAYKHVEDLQASKLNKDKMAEINTFYSDKYAAQTHLMKMIVLMFGVVLVLAIFNNMYILPRPVFIWLSAITIAVFLIIILKKWFDFSSRDNRNFNRYNFKGEDDVTDSTTSLNLAQQQENKKKFNKLVKGELGANTGGDKCVGKECCSKDAVWDTVRKECVNKLSYEQKSDIEQLKKKSGSRNEGFMNKLETFNSGKLYTPV